jgi:MFS family permease
MLSLNAANFKANIYIWTGLTGTVDIFGYIVSIFILKFSTRRLSQFTLFVLAGAFLLAVLGVSKDKEIVLLVLAMMSRFCITSVYAIMTLHTAEMFPTEIRNSVLGISSTAAHFGSFFAPYIGKLRATYAQTIEDKHYLNNLHFNLKLIYSVHGPGIFQQQYVVHSSFLLDS